MEDIAWQANPVLRGWFAYFTCSIRAGWSRCAGALIAS
ncbi:hypothetical protein ABZ897_56940 [Nonomuraea sp. NPDC046802]